MNIMSFKEFVENFYGKKNDLAALTQLKREKPEIYNQYDQRCKRVDLWRQRTNAQPITPENFLEMENMADGFILLWGEENA